MNTSNNKRKKASKDKIEKVFLQLVQRYEVEEISVSYICKLAEVNRSTFYANYLDIYDLRDQARTRMIHEFANIFMDDPKAGHNRESFLKMLNHVKENQIFYKTYFKLNYDAINDDIGFEKQSGNIDYHRLFFKAGFGAILKTWLKHNCEESPEALADIVTMEYQNSKDREKLKI